MIGNGKEQHVMTEVEEQEQKLVYLNIFNYIFVMLKFFSSSFQYYIL